MTVPAQYTWELVRGDDSTRVFKYQDTTGSGINLTGYTVALEVTRAGVLSSIAGTLTDATNGVITVTIPNATTATWSSNPTFKLRLTSGGGAKTTILIGDFEVTQ